MGCFENWQRASEYGGGSCLNAQPWSSIRLLIVAFQCSHVINFSSYEPWADLDLRFMKDKFLPHNLRGDSIRLRHFGHRGRTGLLTVSEIADSL